MRKIILYIAASLDGFIAREDGDVKWLDDIEPTDNPNEDYGYGELMKRVDTTIMGNATYRQVRGWDIPFPYPDLKNYVITTDPSKTQDEYGEYVSGDIKHFFTRLKEQEGKDIWLIGGGKVNTLFMNMGLVDEIIVTQFPIVLGKGIPLFAGTNAEHKLKLNSVKQYDNGLVKMKYLI